MPTRSWLGKAKSVHDLGNFYYIPQDPVRWDDKQDLAKDANWLRELKKPIPVAEAYRDYFGSRMHDSWVTGIERTPNLVRILLDSIDADIFAVALAEILERNPTPSRWPIDLLLHDPSFVRAARYDPSGALRFADWHEIHSEGPQRGDQFLRDWFHEEAGRIQWIAEVYAWREITHRLSSSIFLMIDATRATAVDRRRPALVDAYGSAAGLLWDDAWAVPPSRFSIWNAPYMESFLLERFEARGLTPADFP